MMILRITLQNCFYCNLSIALVALISFSRGLTLPQLVSQKSFAGLKIHQQNNFSTLVLSDCKERDTITSNELPPVLQDIVDERREYELKLGKAMDTLRKDYPELLRRKPDYSIYHEVIKVLDPSGVQTLGLTNYKNSFRVLQSLVGLIYNTDKSRIQSRMIYDFSRSSIRVSWNVVLVPKVVGNARNSLYVDGVSVYNLNAKGEIIEHRFEKLLMNNNPVEPPYNVFLSFSQSLMNPNGGLVPVGIGA